MLTAPFHERLIIIPNAQSNVKHFLKKFLIFIFRLISAPFPLDLFCRKRPFSCSRYRISSGGDHTYCGDPCALFASTSHCDFGSWTRPNPAQGDAFFQYSRLVSYRSVFAAASFRRRREHNLIQRKMQALGQRKLILHRGPLSPLSRCLTRAGVTPSSSAACS